MKITCTEESGKIGNITHITVNERNETGYHVCSGCKQPLDIKKAYVIIKNVDEHTRKHYAVHKRCGISMINKD